MSLPQSQQRPTCRLFSPPPRNTSTPNDATEDVPGQWTDLVEHLRPGQPPTRPPRPLGEPFNLSVAFRHSGWRTHREAVYASLQRCGVSPSRRDNFATCGSHAYILRSIDNPAVYRIAGSACHDRFCVPCGAERSRTIAANVLEQLGNSRCRFLTLTLVQGTDTLRVALDRLTSCFARLRRTPLWASKVDGGVAFIEVKYRSGGNRWHPHLHCLVEGRYIPQRQLSAAWQAITGDSYIVDLRAIKSHDHAAKYVTKYASKPLNMSFLHLPDRLDEAVRELKGKRLAITFGTWKGLQARSPITDTGWLILGSLESLAYAAAGGDADAATAIQSACGDRAQAVLDAAARDLPPPEPPPKRPSQLTFWQRSEQPKGDTRP